MPEIKRNLSGRIWGCCLLLLLLAQVGLAQGFTLNGRVLDAKTALPVQGVSIQFNNSGKTAVTNASGSFSLQIDTVSAKQILTFSHLNYEKLSVKLQPGQTEISVKLVPKTNTLSEVEITASKKLKPAKILPETVLDFAITQNRLFVLAWETEQKTPTLQVLNLQTDSLLLNCRLPDYVEKLYVDCLENLHLLAEKNVYQVYLDSVSLSLYSPEPRIAFEEHLLPCLATDTKYAYLRRNINKGVIVSFFAVNQQTYQATLLRTVADKTVLTMQQDEERFQFMRAGGGGGENINRTQYDAANSRLFGQKVMFRLPYVPLLKIGNQLCLFDHVNGNIEFYGNDSLQRFLAINYHLQPNWSKQNLVDPVHAKAYVLFSKNGFPELRKLNLETGGLETTYRIPNPFAEKLVVHNGLVYFLYKDQAKGNRQFLYKAPLNVLEN